MPKNKNTKFKRRMSLAGAIAMVASVIMPTANTFAAWPDRDTYTNDNPPSHVIFNSIEDNVKLGNEMEFVRIREYTGDDSVEYSAVIDGDQNGKFKIEPGKTYQVYIYYHNNAASNTNVTPKDGIKFSADDFQAEGAISTTAINDSSNVAYNASVRSWFPANVTNDATQNYEIGASIAADNMVIEKDGQQIEGKAVQDTLYLTTDSETQVRLNYVKGSAQIYNTSKFYDLDYFKKIVTAWYYNTSAKRLACTTVEADCGLKANEDGSIKGTIYNIFSYDDFMASDNANIVKIRTNLEAAAQAEYNKYQNEFVPGAWDEKLDENGKTVTNEYGVEVRDGKTIKNGQMVDDTEGIRNVLNDEMLFASSDDKAQLLGFSSTAYYTKKDGTKVYGLNGILPGCAEYSGHITYLLKAEAMNSTVSKSASLDGENFYEKGVDAKPGDTITYKVEWTNTGSEPVEAGFKDKLPAGTTFVPGSFKYCLQSDTEGCVVSNYANWTELKDDSLANGVNLGKFDPTKGVRIMYQATVDVKDENGVEICTDRNIVNTILVDYNSINADGSTSDHSQHNDASTTVVVKADCTPEEDEPDVPTETELPKTGPGEIALALVAAVCVTVGAVYWYRSQRELSDYQTASKSKK